MYAKYVAENSGSQDKLQTKHLSKYIEIPSQQIVEYCGLVQY